MRKSASSGVAFGMSTRSNNMATGRTTKNDVDGNENKMDGLRKSKFQSNTTKFKGPANGQRAPLGALVQNVPVAPKRQTKQYVSMGAASSKLTKENKLEKQASLAIHPHKQRSAFLVHHDDEDTVKANQNITTVKVDVPNVTSSSSYEQEMKEGEIAVVVRQPLSSLSLNGDNLKESPMVLDLSISLDSDTKENHEVVEEATSFSSVRDELLVAEYAKDIYDYLREAELRFQPKPNYMKKQPDITNGMRSILVDWLVEVAEEYKLQPETLYLAVGYIDRFLSMMSVLRGKLQLVGTASMFVASKYEEIYPPEIDEFVYITDDTYSKKQVLRMEQIILRVLSFDLAAPTPYYFLQRYFHLGKLDEKCQHLALYLCELTLLEADPYLQFLPSVIAGSAVCLACHTLEQNPWNEELQSYTNYSIEDFKPCLAFLHQSFANVCNYPQQAVREKYRSNKFSEMANILPPTSLLV